MKKQLVLLCLFAVFAAFALEPAEGNGLICIGGKRLNLVIEPEGEQVIRNQFVQILHQITGVKIPQFKAPDPKLNNCVLHFLTPKASAAMQTKDPEAVYFIKMGADRHVYFGGNVAYAVYDFLKRYAGYRQFGAMKEDIVIPHREFIELPENIDLEEKPSIRSYLVGGSENPYFGRNDRMVSKGTHAFWQLLPPGKYGTTHPEYYPLIDNKRRVPRADAKSGWQPCLANKDLPGLVMQYADAYFKAHPNHISLPLGVNDSAGDCLCQYCTGQYKKYGNQYVKFYNDMAKLLAKRHPGKLLSFIGYGKKSCSVPHGITMEPNILIEVIGINEAEMAKWKKAGIRHFGFYDYLYTAGTGFLVPRYFPQKHAEAWKRLHQEYNLTSIFSEYVPVETVIEGARQYVLDEITWNIQADPQTLLKDYFDSMYEQAAGPVGRFYGRLEELTARDPRLFSVMLRWRNAEQLETYTAEDLSYLDQQLEEAKKIQVSEAVSARLHRLEKFYALFRNYAALSVRAREIAAAAAENQAAIESILQKYREACLLLKDIAEFSMTPEEEASIFYLKRSNLQKFKKQYNLAAEPILDSVADEALAKVSEFQKKQGADVAAYWQAQIQQAKTPREIAGYQLQLQTAALTLDEKEYIRNGSFEKDGQGSLYAWNIWRSSKEEASIELTDQEHYEGNYSVCVGRNVNDSILYTWGLKVIPGERYKITCHVKRTGNAACSRKGRILLKSASNGAVFASKTIPETLDKWTRMELYVTIPDGNETAVFAVSGPVQQDDSRFYVDAISMHRIFTPEKNADKQ